MKIVRGRPPNFDAIVAVIPAAARPGVMFTFGDSIYATDGREISSWLIAHEEVHSLRQGGSPERWWKEYLADPNFRFEEEAVAHKIEWLTWIKTGQRNRHQRRAMMAIVAGRLAGPLYGRMVDFDKAKEIILEGIPA